jgi:CRP-like cAMP-binding protein
MDDARAVSRKLLISRNRKETVMFLTKTDFFKDMKEGAVHEISEIAVEESHDAGTRLFAPGDSANDFFLLVEGSVRISIGKSNHKEYVVQNGGEAFGWSSVVGNDVYTADAICMAPTRLLRISKTDLEKVFENHERSGRQFYLTLARQLGKRLVDMHK